MAEKEKVKIAYATRPVEVTDEQGNKTVVYKKYHPVTTGNAVVVGGKTLTKKLEEALVKTEQTLSDEEKAQVRANIGAVSASEVDSCFVIEDGLVCQTFNE